MISRSGSKAIYCSLDDFFVQCLIWGSLWRFVSFCYNFIFARAFRVRSVEK